MAPIFLKLKMKLKQNYINKKKKEWSVHAKAVWSRGIESEDLYCYEFFLNH